MASFRFSGERLRELREQRGIRPEAVAAHIDRSLSTVVLYESGRVVPPGRIIAELAELLDVEPGELFARVEASA